jgi:phosphatidylglycerol:prolipoprotein diacylglycerol transferase
MHPTLFTLGKLSLHSYGLMLALSFLAGIYLACYRARKRGIEIQHILDLSVYIIVAAIIGSRLAYIAFHLSEYRSILDMFALWQGGATLYGGLLLAVAASYLFSLRRGINFLLLADIVAPSIAVGAGLTRVGCFLSGCCFGMPTNLPWGVVFPPLSPAGAYELSLRAGVIRLHPTQLYDSLGCLIIVLLLLRLERWLPGNGRLFGAFLILYGILRFLVDFLRFYEANMIVDGLTLNQILSVALMGCGAVLVARRGRRSEKH